MWKIPNPLLLKILVPIVLLAGSAAVAYTLVVNRPEIEPKVREPFVPSVRVHRVEKGDVKLAVTTYGTVKARTEITLVPQVGGIIENLSPKLKAGGYFRKGEVLVEIDRRDYDLAVIQAEAGVAEAQAALDREIAESKIAQREWDRFGRGEANGLVLRKPQLAQAKARLASAEALLEQARLNLERTRIVAPFDGRVLEEQVDRGQYLPAGGQIARVHATDYVEVRVELPDDQVEFLDLPFDWSEAGESPFQGIPGVELFANLGGRVIRWEGPLVRTEASVDARTRVIRAIIRVNDPYGLRTEGRLPLLVGMYLEARIPGRTVKDAVVLPRALLRSGDRVYVVDDEDCLEIRKVTVLKREKDRVIVTAGLEAGELVSVTDLEPVVEGMEVLVVEDPADDRHEDPTGTRTEDLIENRGGMDR